MTGSNYVSTLDDDISIEEIKSAQKNLKEDKSTGDGWVKKMVTNVPAAILLLLQLIYKTILYFPNSMPNDSYQRNFQKQGFTVVGKEL